jgi:hypothetical protein
MDTLKVNQIYLNAYDERVFILYEKDEEFAGVNLMNDDLKWYTLDGHGIKAPDLYSELGTLHALVKGG